MVRFKYLLYILREISREMKFQGKGDYHQDFVKTTVVVVVGGGPTDCGGGYGMELLP